MRALPVLAVLAFASCAPAQDVSTVKAPARVYVIWPARTGVAPFVEALGAAPSEGWSLVGAVALDSGSSPGPVRRPVRSDPWRGAMSRMVDAVVKREATDLVIGPDGRLAHLALQLAVKLGVRVVLVDCPDRTAVELPIPGVTALQLGPGLAPSELGRRVAQHLSHGAR